MDHFQLHCLSNKCYCKSSTDRQLNLEDISNLIVIIVPADAPALVDVKASTGTVITKLDSGNIWDIHLKDWCVVVQTHICNWDLHEVFHKIDTTDSNR